MTLLQSLCRQLSLEPLGNDTFQGISVDILGTKRIFGGQILGQALMAASKTIPQERTCHSMHAYFIRPGNTDLPVTYEVIRSRDGGSFSFRTVSALQEGKIIFTLQASFQKEESGFEHQDPMPEVPAPETLKNLHQIYDYLKDTLPNHLLKRISRTTPIEIRPLEFINPLYPQAVGPDMSCWFKADGEMPNDPIMHQAMLAYFSDFHILATTLQPHRKNVFDIDMQVATLDHSIWFHKPCNMNEWNLYSTHSPRATSARGLGIGRVFSHDGTLIASMAQEGLIRKH